MSVHDGHMPSRASRERPEYDWLTGVARKSWYQVAEMARGAGVSCDTVREWCASSTILGAVIVGGVVTRVIHSVS